jgi:hypothetical protein
MVGMVGHVNIPRSIYGYIIRLVELIVCRARHTGLSQGGQIIQPGIEDLHAMIASVGNVEIAVRVHCHAAREHELVIAQTRDTAQGSEIAARAGKHLNSVVIAIHHKNIALRANSYV